MINGSITQRGGVSGGLTAGVGGTTDYTELENKPSINGVELVDNKTSAQLGLVGVNDFNNLANIVSNIIGLKDYSIEEQSIGIKWIDGKPLYQKTYANITFPNNDNWVTIDSDFSSEIYEIKEFKTNGFVIDGGGYSNQRYQLIQTSGHFIRISHSGNNLQVCIDGPYIPETIRNKCDLTIIYTKTTDTAEF